MLYYVQVKRERVESEGCTMRKMKVYLDTSVISYLMQENVPEKMADTKQLWEMFKDGKFDVYLSTVTLREIDKCSEPKKTQLIDRLNEIQFTTLDITEDITNVARKIIEMGILTQKSFDDCQHIGAAVVNECDCIISWNFKHIVNVKTIRGVKAITNLEGYKMIEIWNPSVLLESEE